MQILKFNNDKILLNLFDKKIVLTTIIFLKMTDCKINQSCTANWGLLENHRNF